MLPISTKIDDSVAHLHFDDGGLNIMTPEIVSGVLQIVEAMDADKQVSSLLIEGNGKSFCAGLDTSVLLDGGEEADRMRNDTIKLLRTLYKSRLRVICLCAGHAAAVGAMILLVADYRVGVKNNGRIGFSDVASGMSLPEITILLARDRLNKRDLFAATVLSRMYSPERALEAGFLDIVVDQYRDAKYHASQEAIKLGRLDDEAYLTTLKRVRKETLEASEDLII